MPPLRISLVPLGNLKYPIKIPEVVSWRSELISIAHSVQVGHLPDSQGVDWEYPDQQLLEVLGADATADITLGLINARLEENYYLRRLSDNVAVLSLYEMAEIVKASGFSLEQFILRNAYDIAALVRAHEGAIPSEYVSWAHDETRGCLFDMNANKADIVFSLDRPILCPNCRTRLAGRRLPAGFLPRLDKELRRIKRPLFDRASLWIRAHPIAALTITILSGVAINFFASFLYEKAKALLPWLGSSPNAG